jgi:hypothetical protein
MTMIAKKIKTYVSSKKVHRSLRKLPFSLGEQSCPQGQGILVALGYHFKN